MSPKEKPQYQNFVESLSPPDKHPSLTNKNKPLTKMQQRLRAISKDEEENNLKTSMKLTNRATEVINTKSS